MGSPYVMGLEKKEVDRLKKLSQEAKTTTIIPDEAQIATEIGDEGLDTADMVQLSQSINSDARSNADSAAISSSSTNQKTKSKLHDSSNSTANKADEDARKMNDELSKAEPMDRTALQTGSMTKSKTKYIEEIGNEREGEKLGEIIRENAEAAAVGSLDAGHQAEKTEEESRASLSQVLKAEQQNKDEVDEIINTRVVDIEDLAGKSDAEMKSDLEKLKKEEKAADANK